MYFPGPESDQIVFIESDQGAPRVHLLRIRTEAEGGGSEPLWVFELIESSGSVSMTEYYRPGCCAVYDRYGRFFHIDFTGRSQCLIHDYEMESFDARGVISSDKKRLQVLFEKDGEHYLQCWQLPQQEGDGFIAESPIKLDLSGEEDDDDDDDDELDYYISTLDSLFTGPDNSLIIHRTDDCYDDEGERLGYQYLIRIDAVDGRARVLPLPAPPVKWDPEEGVIAIDSRRGLLAQPAVTSLKTVKTADGQQGFLFEIDLFDLGQGELLRTVPVRILLQDQLASHAGDDVEMAAHLTALAAGKQGDGLTLSHRRFLENLYNIRFCREEEALWLCWRGGIVRKVSLDGQWRSPLYVTANVTDSTLNGPFEHRLLHVEFICCEPEPLLSDGRRFGHQHPRPLPASLPDAPAAMDEWQSVELRTVYMDDNWQLSEQQRRDINRLGKTVIEVSDLNSDVALGFALRRLALKTEEMAWLRRGNRIAFLFEDETRQWDEDAFFRRAVQLPDGPERMARLIEDFCNYEEADCCYCDYEKTTLADCAFQLAMEDPGRLPLLSRYLNVLDMDHECFFTQDGIYKLIEKYAQHPQWRAFYDSLPYPLNNDEDEWDEDWEEEI